MEVVQDEDAIAWVGVVAVLLSAMVIGATWVSLVPAWPKGLGFPNYMTNAGRGVTIQQIRRPRHVLLHDLIDPNLLTTSWLMPRWGVACLRGCFVVLYLCTFIFPHASGYDDYPTRGYLRFFTNWGINLLCITGIIGLSIYVYECFFAQQGYQKQDSEMGHKSDYRPDVGDTAHGAQRSVAPSNGPTSGQEQAHTDAAKEGSEPALAVGPDYRKHWRWYHRFFHVLYTTMSSAALMLTIFYWALLYDPDEPEFDNFGMRAKNVMVHGLNSAIFLVDVMLTNVPVASYHVALIASYLGIYEVYMWLDFAVSRDWTYNDIGWSKGINIAFIFASCILAFLSHFGVLGVGYLREFLIRISGRARG